MKSGRTVLGIFKSPIQTLSLSISRDKLNVGNKHDLVEFRLAQSVLKDMPAFILILQEMEDKVSKYKKYAVAQRMLDGIEESLVSARKINNYYKKVIDNKGAKNV